MTLEDATTLFIAAKQSRGLSQTTLRWYSDHIRVFARWLEASEWIQRGWFCPEAIEAFLEAERVRGLSDASIAGHFRALSALFKWLRKRRHLPRDMELPTEMMEAPKVPERQKPHVKPSEFEALLDSIPYLTWVNYRDRLAINTMFLCGIRRAEVVNLHIADYDLEAECLHVRNGKGGDDRYVPLLAPVIDAFVDYMVVRPEWDGPEVFLACCNRRPDGVLTGNGLLQRLRVLCRKAEMRSLNPHAFRHGLAIHLLNDKGAQMSLIQRILGHKKLTTTSEVYAKWQMTGIQAQYVRLMSD